MKNRVHSQSLINLNRNELYTNCPIRLSSKNKITQTIIFIQAIIGNNLQLFQKNKRPIGT